MLKHSCKLCFRSFANGRALGGHMRSHVAASNKSAPAQIHKLDFSSSPSASFFSSTSEDDDDDEKGYGLRENPKKSYRLADPGFSAAALDAAASSYALLHDRESETETESSRARPTHRRRSKRARPPATPPTPEPEPISSVSDASPEEDVAISLMMLSRDTWNKNHNEDRDDEEEVDEEKEEEEELRTNKGKSKYQCKTCKKPFRSYQALGGHRASHKKFKSCVPPPPSSSPVLVPVPARIYDVDLAEANSEKVVHECPICFRIFASGQALGGHKRSHLTPSATATIAKTPPPPPAASVSASVSVPKFADTMIDLNLPAPMEDDADRLSAVSDELNWVGYKEVTNQPESIKK